MSNSRRSALLSILFWSVISAAFIGPGTVTTAARAGAGFGYALLWALLFSTLACIVLQEAAARLPMVSGLNLGQAIARRYGKRSPAAWLAGGTIILGGIAYQAGNILGAVSGIELLIGWPSQLLTGVIAMSCAALLWFGTYQSLARLLGFVVAFMGLAFIFVALSLDLDAVAVTRGAIIPQIPEGAGWLVVGLIGTTIVPYNLFLGSGLSKDPSISNMRLGLGVAILLGGLISMAVLLVGSSITGEFSFMAISTAMEQQLGEGAVWLFGLGLFAAGFTSSLTAPLAAAITAESIFEPESFQQAQSSGKLGRWIWALVLGAGFLFGVSGVKPIPVILMAQAFNGLLLPLISLFLLLAVNDAHLVARDKLNPLWSNILMLLVLAFTTFLGLNNMLKAAYGALGQTAPQEGVLVWGLMLLACLVSGAAAWGIKKLRMKT